MSNTTFVTTRLAGQRLSVTDGADRAVILSTVEWDAVAAELGKTDVGAKMDEAIKEFFAPLTAALEEASIEYEPVIDEAFTIVVGEDVEASAGAAAKVFNLSQEAAVVRMLTSGDTDRLVWVGNGPAATIEITAMDDQVGVKNDISVDELRHTLAGNPPF